MDFNNLEALLRNGTSADEIAQAFTKNLNNAIDAVKPTPMEIAGEDLAKAWNRMVDLYLEDNDAPSFIDDTDDLYISTETATRLFEESMALLHKVSPLWDALIRIAEDEPIPTPKPVTQPAAKAEESKIFGDVNYIDEFDKVIKSFLGSK